MTKFSAQTLNNGAVCTFELIVTIDIIIHYFHITAKNCAKSP